MSDEDFWWAYRAACLRFSLGRAVFDEVPFVLLCEQGVGTRGIDGAAARGQAFGDLAQFLLPDVGVHLGGSHMFEFVQQ